MSGRIAEKRKRGLKEIPKDTDGRWKTARLSQQIKEDRKTVRRSILGHRIFYICPKCGKILEFRKKKNVSACKRCGQKLDWSGYEDMQAVYILAEDPEEAAYWAGQYEYFNGTTYDIDVDQWRLIRKEYPRILYFPFPEGKDYGRFMRKAAKEAKIMTDFDDFRRRQKCHGGYG